MLQALLGGLAAVSWVDRPDELVEIIRSCRDTMNDTPAPAGVEELDDDGRGGATHRATASCARQEVRVTMTLDDQGEVGAFTDLRATPGNNSSDGRHSSHRMARGLGLARAVEDEILRRLQAERAEVETVSTMNTERDVAMRHIDTRSLVHLDADDDGAQPDPDHALRIRLRYVLHGLEVGHERAR